MAKGMERVEKFEKMVEKVDTFIQASTTFLYDHIEDPNSAEVIECTRAISLSNLDFIQRKEDSLNRLRETMANCAPITASIIKNQPTTNKDKKTPRTFKNIQELIDHITYSNLDSDSLRVLEQQPHEDRARVKLHFYKLILETKKVIRELCLSDPFADIKELQSDLEMFTLILDTIKEIDQKKEIEETPKEEKEYSNIIFAPNGKRSTYIFDDISEFSEKAKEIKLIIDKLRDGYFLKTKDTKSIEGYQENIYEYKHPNGIRILYIVEGNIIIICSLFMKDKQKSSRITNEYDEAINRYYSSREYIINNFNDPYFHIEQSELIGEIYQLFEDMGLSKKVGDE